MLLDDAARLVCQALGLVRERLLEIPGRAAPRARQICTGRLRLQAVLQAEATAGVDGPEHLPGATSRTRRNRRRRRSRSRSGASWRSSATATAARDGGVSLSFQSVLWLVPKQAMGTPPNVFFADRGEAAASDQTISEYTRGALRDRLRTDPAAERGRDDRKREGVDSGAAATATGAHTRLSSRSSSREWHAG